MSYALAPLDASTPAAAPTLAAANAPKKQWVNIGLEVEIPESAERFADLVVKTHAFRRTARELIGTPRPKASPRVFDGLAHAVPVMIGVASLIAGVGEGVAGALALWGGLRCAVPARVAFSGVSLKTAGAVRDAAVAASSGGDATTVAALRYAAAAALEEAGELYGLSPKAELIAQTLVFAPPPADGSDTLARRAAAVADKLLWRFGGDGYRTQGSLDDIGPYEALALASRSTHFPVGGGYSNATLDKAMGKAKSALADAARDAVRTLISERER